jgi:tetratricopeptide (TPR) repeat protein
LGREVARRDTQIRLLVAGHIEKVNAGYALSARILRAGDGTVTAHVSESANDASDLVAAAGRLSARLRRRLDDSAAAVHEAVPSAGTESLRALHLYAQALTLLRREPRDPRAAEVLLRESVTHDPGFALARLALGQAILAGRTGEPARLEALQHLDLAERRAAQSSDAERLFISAELAAAKAQIAGQRNASGLEYLQQAAAAYEALVRLQPANERALSELVFVYRSLGRPEEAYDWVERLAKLRPNGTEAQIHAARNMLEAGRLDRAVEYGERAYGLGLPLNQLRPIHAAWMATYPSLRAWLQDDMQGTLEATDRLAAVAGSMPPRMQRELELYLVSWYLTLGCLDRAEQLLSVSTGEQRDFHLAIVKAQEADTSGLATHLLDRFADPVQARRVGSLWIDAGLLDRAREVTSANPAPAYVGQLALAEGRYEFAIRAFRDDLRRDLRFGSPGTGRVTRKLADALIAVGLADEAIGVLNGVSRWRSATGPPSAYEWLRVRDRLAVLYRDLGRVAEAEAVESELLTHLAVADDDHPIKRRLMQSHVAAR